MSSGTAYDFRVRNKNKQAQIRKALEAYCPNDETPAESQSVCEMLAHLETIEARREAALSRDRPKWKRDRSGRWAGRL